MSWLAAMVLVALAAWGCVKMPTWEEGSALSSLLLAILVVALLVLLDVIS